MLNRLPYNLTRSSLCIDGYFDLFLILQIELNANEKQILESWQAGDMALYRHFQEKFQTLVSQTH